LAFFKDVASYLVLQIADARHCVSEYVHVDILYTNMITDIEVSVFSWYDSRTYTWCIGHCHQSWRHGSDTWNLQKLQCRMRAVFSVILASHFVSYFSVAHVMQKQNSCGQCKKYGYISRHLQPLTVFHSPNS